MSGEGTKDYSAIAGVLPPLYLIFKYLLSNNNNNTFENMLKLTYILFVYLILSKIHLQTQYVLMFIAKYYLRITRKILTNTHIHSSILANKKCIRLICIQVHNITITSYRLIKCFTFCINDFILKVSALCNRSSSNLDINSNS